MINKVNKLILHTGILLSLCLMLCAVPVVTAWAADTDQSETQITETNKTDEDVAETQASTSKGTTSKSTTTKTKKITRKLDFPVMNAPVRTDSSVVRLSWSKVKNATGYLVYRSKIRTGEYKLLTKKPIKKTQYSDKTGKAKQTYYYKVQAVNTKTYAKVVYKASRLSKSVSAKVRVTPKRIAYVGDSIFYGFHEYGVIPNTSSSRVIAKIGIQTYVFYNSSYMSTLLSYNPDRIYISLCINALGKTIETGYFNYTVSFYKKIIDKCLKKNPDVEIVIIPVTPVSRGASVARSCRDKMNSLIRTMYENNYKSNPNIRLMETDDLLGDSQGYLLSSYNGGDGIHWRYSAYKMMYKAFKQYGKEW